MEILHTGNHSMGEDDRVVDQLVEHPLERCLFLKKTLLH